MWTKFICYPDVVLKSLCEFDNKASGFRWVLSSRKGHYIKIYCYPHEFLMYGKKMGIYELRPKVSASCVLLVSRIFKGHV